MTLGWLGVWGGCASVLLARVIPNGDALLVLGLLFIIVGARLLAEATRGP